MTTRNDVVGTFNNYADEQEAALKSEQAAHAATKVTLQQSQSDLAALQNTYDAHMATHTAVKPPEPTPSAFLVGGAVGGNADPTSWETRMGVPIGVRRTYYTSSQQSSAITHVKANITAKRKCSEISFKPPVAWSSAATGGADAWFKDIVAKLVAIPEVTGGTHLVKLIVHHEPENDKEPNMGTTTAGRDNWKAMQNRLAPFADKPGIEFVCCLMGYHSFFGTATMKALWHPDACIPKNKAVKAVSFDLYEKHGPFLDTTKPPETGWTNWDSYFTPIKAFVDKRTAEGYPIKWGMSEWGAAEQCEDEKPGYMETVCGKMKQYGGTWSSYFNSTLNSTKHWAFVAGDNREQAYTKVRKANA